jgi:S1-C subfamily serine protease
MNPIHLGAAMFRRFLLVMMALTADAPLTADDRISPQVLDRIKAATVFVKSKSGADHGIGTGFLIQPSPDRHYIITNYFTVNPGPPPPIIAGPRDRARRTPTIEVVFNSGQPGEQTYRADVVTEDPTNYLALLRLRDAKSLPAALDYKTNVQLTETLPVYFLGFPFGQELGSSGKNPNISVGRGSISSIRTNDRGEKIIQIDGDLNPGNAGGPIVDAQGRLLGVAIIKIAGTKIGLITPAGQIAKLMEPRIPRLSLTSGSWADRQAAVQCTADVYDPLGRIQKMELRYGLAENRAPLRKSSGTTWPEMDNASSVNLTLGDGKATAKLNVGVGPSPPARIAVQVIVTYDDQSVGRSNVRTLSIRPGQTVSTDSDNPLAIGPRDLIERDTSAATAKRMASVVGRLSVPASAEGHRNLGSQQQRLCWSLDGQTLFYLDNDVIRQLRVPDLHQVASSSSPLRTNLSLAMSANGLVLFGGGHPDDSAAPPVPPVHRVIVCNPANFATLQSIPLKGYHVRLATAPTAKHAFVSNRPIRNAGLTAIDLTKGTIAKEHGLNDLGFPEPSLEGVVMSHDGQWLVSRSSNQLFRFRVSGADVTLDDSSPQILDGSSPEDPVISYDGKWVRATCKDRVFGPTPDGRRGYSTHLFSTESFAKPARSLDGLESPRVAGFDRRHGRIYFHSPTRIDVFASSGDYVAGYELGNSPVSQRNIQQMLVHPDGQFIAFLIPNSTASESLIVLLSITGNP